MVWCSKSPSASTRNQDCLSSQSQYRPLVIHCCRSFFSAKEYVGYSNISSSFINSPIIPDARSPSSVSDPKIPADPIQTTENEHRELVALVVQQHLVQFPEQSYHTTLLSSSRRFFRLLTPIVSPLLP